MERDNHFVRLEIPEKFVDISVSFVESVEKFFVQPLRFARKIEQFTVDLLAHCDATSPPGCEEVVVGTNVAAQYVTGDGGWYRAKVVDRVSPTKWKVFFLDYGNEEIVALSNIRALADTSTMCELPPLSVRCSLSMLSNETVQADIFRQCVEGQSYCARLDDFDGSTHKITLFTLSDGSEVTVNELLLEHRYFPSQSAASSSCHVSLSANNEAPCSSQAVAPAVQCDLVGGISAEVNGRSNYDVVPPVTVTGILNSAVNSRAPSRSFEGRVVCKPVPQRNVLDIWQHVLLNPPRDFPIEVFVGERTVYFCSAYSYKEVYVILAKDLQLRHFVLQELVKLYNGPNDIPHLTYDQLVDRLLIVTRVQGNSPWFRGCVENSSSGSILDIDTGKKYLFEECYPLKPMSPVLMAIAPRLVCCCELSGLPESDRNMKPNVWSLKFTEIVENMIEPLKCKIMNSNFEPFLATLRDSETGAIVSVHTLTMANTENESLKTTPDVLVDVHRCIDDAFNGYGSVGSSTESEDEALLKSGRNFPKCSRETDKLKGSKVPTLPAMTLSAMDKFSLNNDINSPGNVDVVLPNNVENSVFPDSREQETSEEKPGKEVMYNIHLDIEAAMAGDASEGSAVEESDSEDEKTDKGKLKRANKSKQKEATRTDASLTKSNVAVSVSMGKSVAASSFAFSFSPSSVLSTRYYSSICPQKDIKPNRVLQVTVTGFQSAYDFSVAKSPKLTQLREKLDRHCSSLTLLAPDVVKTQQYYIAWEPVNKYWARCCCTFRESDRACFYDLDTGNNITLVYCSDFKLVPIDNNFLMPALRYRCMLSSVSNESFRKVVGQQNNFICKFLKKASATHYMVELYDLNNQELRFENQVFENSDEVQQSKDDNSVVSSSNVSISSLEKESLFSCPYFVAKLQSEPPLTVAVSVSVAHYDKGTIHVMLTRHEKLRNKMCSQLTDVFSILSCVPRKHNAFIQENALVIAHVPDGNVYRSRVLVFDAANKDTALVEFLDYGQSMTLPVKEIFPAPVRFFQNPPLAYRCRLKCDPVDMFLLSDPGFCKWMQEEVVGSGHFTGIFAQDSQLHCEASFSLELSNVLTNLPILDSYKKRCAHDEAQNSPTVSY